MVRFTIQYSVHLLNSTIRLTFINDGGVSKRKVFKWFWVTVRVKVRIITFVIDFD